MMDHFDAKRGMVKQLLDMLKKNASDEVGNGLQAPEGSPVDEHGVQIERVEVLPEHKMDEPTPEHDVITHELSEGGTVPAPKEGQPDKEGSAHEEATESESEREAEGDIEPMHPAFSTFLKKGKKK
jgi:hypothetical protein